MVYMIHVCGKVQRGEDRMEALGVGSSKCHDGVTYCSYMINMCDVAYIIHVRGTVKGGEDRMESRRSGFVKMPRG